MVLALLHLSVLSLVLVLSGQLLLSMQVTRDDERMLQDIQRFYNTVIEELPSNVADLI
jgi:hypothetical protein